MNILDLNKLEQDVILKMSIITDEFSGVDQDDYEQVRIKGNPYYACKYCRNTSPEIDISGHRNNCYYGEARKEYLKLKSFLSTETVKNLTYYIDQLNIE